MSIHILGLTTVHVSYIYEICDISGMLTKGSKARLPVVQYFGLWRYVRKANHPCHKLILSDRRAIEYSRGERCEDFGLYRVFYFHCSHILLGLSYGQSVVEGLVTVFNKGPNWVQRQVKIMGGMGRG